MSIKNRNFGFLRDFLTFSYFSKKLEERAKEAHEFYKSEEPSSGKSKVEETKETDSPKEADSPKNGEQSQLIETLEEPPKILETEIQPIEPMDTNPCDTLLVTESDADIPVPSVNPTDSDLCEPLKVTDSDMADTEGQSESIKEMEPVNPIDSDFSEPLKMADSGLNESIKDQEMEAVINKSYHADEIIEQIEMDSEPSTSAKHTEIDYDFEDEKEKRKAEILAQAKVDRPCLRGGPDVFIDLDTGDFVSKNKTGAEILLQRFNRCTTKKHQSKADLAILSVDHGVAHVDHYMVKVDNDEEAKTKNPIPGNEKK